MARDEFREAGQLMRIDGMLELGLGPKGIREPTERFLRQYVIKKSLRSNFVLETPLKLQCGEQWGHPGWVVGSSMGERVAGADRLKWQILEIFRQYGTSLGP